VSPRHKSPKRYPRVARVNQVLREVVADELERLDDERLGLTTVTGVAVDPDLRHAVVWLSSEPSDEAAAALAEHRVRVQAAIGRQLRLKRTPGLDFKADPGVLTGERVDAILREMREHELGGEEDDEA
jgi:ribosome-binding factor A